MKISINYFIVFCLVISSSIGFAQSFEEKVTNASQVRLNVTNVGTYGNAFRGYRDGSGAQSCEYPAGSGVEHLFESGIWVGGYVNGQVFVSTSAYDASQGYATGRAGFEFTPVDGAFMNTRSSLFNSPDFSNEAVSHEDILVAYTDKNILVPGTNIPIQSHLNPLFVDVYQETYNWNYTFSDFMVIQNYYIVNNSNSTIDSAYFALWANTVVRNVNVTPAGSGGSAFYNKGGNGYLDSLYMAYCFDHSGDVGFTDSYVGQKFLGAEDKNGFQHPALDSTYSPLLGRWVKDLTFEDHYNAWQFNNSTDPIFFLPGTDNDRYIKMTSGLNDLPCWNTLGSTNPKCVSFDTETISDVLSEDGNRADLVSVGPFKDFAPGDTITLAYAYVMAKKIEDGLPNSENNPTQQGELISHAEWAQTAYNGEDTNFNGVLDEGEDKDGDGEITRFILPTPPDAPIIKAVASNNNIDIYWSDNSEFSIDPITQKRDFEGYKVYVTKLGFDVVNVPPTVEWVKVSETDTKGNGIHYETGFETVQLETPAYFDGDTNAYRYKFTLENIQNGWQYAIAVTAFDQGESEINLEILESSPSANEIRVFAGTPPSTDMKEDEPFVYPNPYYATASWEGVSNFQEESRKIIFANLPERCKIRVFTSGGDLIDSFEHDSYYDGSDIRWFRSFGSENSENNVFSGGEHAWDLLSKDNQIISRGIYLFSVEDLDSGELFKGRFIIIK